LGCNNFGRSLDAEATAAVVGAALDAGVTFFDTSDNYGECRSEVYLGQALRGHRDDVVIATKFGRPLPGVEGSGGASRRWVRQAVEDSLRRLGTDRIDLYYLHLPDPATSIEETLSALDELVQAGVVREIACSNLDAAQIDAATDTAKRLGTARFVCTQVQYSLLHRDPESDGIVDACRRRDIALVPYHPLASGLLTGKHSRTHISGRLTMQRYQPFLTERNFGLVDQLAPFAAEHGHQMLDVAFGWLLAKSPVAAVVAGASTPEQARANAAAAQCILTSGEVAELDAITAR
jgi:aryl-alcohol dehydrogenase-like predicted oxidoreductase